MGQNNELVWGIGYDYFIFNIIIFLDVGEPEVVFMLLQLVVCEVTKTVVSSLAILTGVRSFITSFNFTIMKTLLFFLPDARRWCNSKRRQPAGVRPGAGCLPEEVSPTSFHTRSSFMVSGGFVPSSQVDRGLFLFKESLNLQKPSQKLHLTCGVVETLPSKIRVFTSLDSYL